MSSITCSYENDHIVIADKIVDKNGKGTVNEKKIEVNNLFQYFKINNEDDTVIFDDYKKNEGDFILSQQMLRFLDCVKDLKKTDKHLDIFNTPTISSLSFLSLKNLWLKLEDTMDKKNKSRIEKSLGKE